ncbi:MAG: [FeFe] hydrogenase H-cluster radical SAM maturase HydE [Bacilli bacterium]
MIMLNLTKNKKDIKVIELLDKLKKTQKLSKEEYKYILDNIDVNSFDYLKTLSRDVTDLIYGKSVYLRGLIEMSNYCRCSCNYCGLRKENYEVIRYRLSEDEILKSCKTGYELGFKTFVMQGGEDLFFSKEVLSRIISKIRVNFPDVAITLSIGERDYEDYKAFFDAGVNRFLLRHEAFSTKLYKYLHPEPMSYENRIKCLNDLKEIGYQVGVGMMIGVPTQTNEDLAEDLMFITQFQPAMVGIGPYVNHKMTPFKDEQTGNALHTLVMLALIRLIIPKTLIPATTALSTIDKESRIEALKLGANVVMPNLSPYSARVSYEIYEGKKIKGCEAVEDIDKTIKEIEKIGLKVDMSRGDTKMEGYKCL